MFSKVQHTSYPPHHKPLMVYDGNCGFCKYWIIKWKKISGSDVDYRSYQRVGSLFKDIPETHFAQAVRLIMPDGNVISGPDAAYFTYYYKKSFFGFLHVWYSKYLYFSKISDWLYQWIADHRSFMYSLSTLLFGQNPRKYKPYWAIYLFLLIALLSGLIYLV